MNFPGDSLNAILFGDPNNEITTPGVAGIGGITNASGPTNVGGESFFLANEVDVVIENTAFSQSCLNSVMTHEVGHTLGLRHSNQPPSPGDDSTTDAIMNSTTSCSFNGVLRQYDLNAVNTVYGAGPACNAPSISTQPQSKSVSQGSATTLTVAAGGTSPFTFQWFRGSTGDTSQPIGGATSSTLNVDTSVAGTFDFWVRVGHTCDSATINSNTATVTVTCAAPAINSQPQNRNIFEGSSAQLSVGASGGGLTFQWFVGNSGDTSNPVAGGTTSSIVVAPGVTTSYWVRVSGTCGSPVDSNTVTVTVSPCDDVTVDAPTATPNGTGRFTLSVTAFSSNTPLVFSWFRGNTPGFGGTLAGSTQSINVTVTQVTSFWVRVTNGCGKSQVSGLITVAPCTLPSITTQPTDQNIGQGASATLSIVSNGTTVTWFKGAVGNTSQQVGTGTTFNTGTLTATTQYWAQVSNSCGSVSSRQVTVTVQQASEQVKLLNGRFTVEVRYINQLVNPPQNGKLKGRSLFSSSISETAIFSFDDPLVVELMVRVSDARPFDNHIHVFLGGLSDVEFFITVSDSVTGTTKEYHKLPFELKGQVDRSTFVAGNSLQDGIDALMKSASLPAPNADSSTIKLLNNRFQVRMRYRNQFVVPNTEGFLLARSIASSPTTETAVFYFDNAESVEWIVRFSDARPFAQRIDLFHGGLSDVEFSIEVIDTVKGTTRTYDVPPFSLAGAVDRDSFTP